MNSAYLFKRIFAMSNVPIFVLINNNIFNYVGMQFCVHSTEVHTFHIRKFVRYLWLTYGCFMLGICG